MVEKEIWRRWMEQAEADFGKAKVLRDSGDFDGVIFYSQQAIEKGLKALRFRKDMSFLKIHDLVKLASDFNLPEEFFSGLDDLSSFYIEARYCLGIEDGIPANKFILEDAEKFIKITEDVLKWIKERV
jgi:HEPN domain-containing protein